MAKRAGPSISVKMILTSTLLVLLTVVGLGFMNVINTGKVYDDNAAAREKQFADSLDERSQAATGGVVPPLKPLLIDGRADEIKELARDMAATSGQGLQLVVIMTGRKEVLIHCEVTGETEKPCDETAYKQNDDGTFPVYKDEVWTDIQKKWGEANASKVVSVQDDA